MTAVNRILGRLVDALLAPLGTLPPLAALALVAFAVALGMLLVYRATSNQPAIARAKGRMLAGLFEIRLFNDDLRTILRAQGDMLRHNLTYLRHSLVPMLVLLVPLVLLVAQLQALYGWSGLRPGESFVLETQLRPGAAAGVARPDVRLRLPDGLRAETSDLWLPARGEMSWRLRAERPGRYTVVLEHDGATATKDVRVAAAGEAPARLSPVRHQPGLAAQILYPV
jgi:hypothetical protein